jgi:SOS response regulatory protein OraA/RecX
MARVISIEEGASGVAKAATAEGSLFVFRTCYLAPACSCCGIDEIPELSPDDELDETLMSVLIDAMTAEYRAVYLLAKAEQYRRGLERKLLGNKLSGKGLPAQAVDMALDHLEAEGLLSDRRYAETWMRQRVRRHPEGPRSLAAALAARGVARDASREALAAFFDEARRFGLLAAAAAMLEQKLQDSSMVRQRLIELGWRSSEISEYLLSCSSDA